MKNKPNFAEGEMSVCSLKTRNYVDYMRFMVEKNKANFDKTSETRLQTQDKKDENKRGVKEFSDFFKKMELFSQFICLMYWSKDYD